MKNSSLYVSLALLAATLVNAQSTTPLGPLPGASGAPADPFAPAPPSRAAKIDRLDVHLEGVSAVQLAWWFQHIADDQGKYWQPLNPMANQNIAWRVNPREDAHQIIGALFVSDQKTTGGVFAHDALHMQMQFQDYITQNRTDPAGQARALNPTMTVPADYSPAYPSPLTVGGMGMPVDPTKNGFNEQILLFDGQGFSQGRLLISWKNTGSDDTLRTLKMPVGIDVAVTLYQVWMEGSNRPPALAADGYYYNDAQARSIETLWRDMLKAMPQYLPQWFVASTQDDLARQKGWTVTSVIDTGLVEGVDSKMMVWWWNHAMGDAPGISYSLWCPPAHYAIRWLPGYSPAEVLHSKTVPTDHVVPGTIYPDLQGDHLEQNGGGMMSFPTAMSPIPGIYKTLDPMFPVSKADVDNFSKVRFPPPRGWLLHQWEDRPEGMIHRSTVLGKLPLMAPVTQQGFYSEHQLMEGQFWGTPGMRKAYAEWLKQPH